MTAIQQFKYSQLVRFLLIGFLILVLQIPSLMLQNLINERQSVRQEAVTGVTQDWGQAQTIMGPKLVVPYIKRFQADGKEKTQSSYGVFLPDTLQINGDLDTDVRRLNIFEVPIYKAKLDIKGQFTRPDLSDWGVRPEDINWNRAEVVLQISDARAIKNQATLQWNQKPIPFTASTGKFLEGQGIHASLKGIAQADTYAFSIPLEINGSDKIGLTPLGRVSKMKLTADWPDPWFQGNIPSDKPKVNEKGFEASWDVASLGRNFPQQWNKDNAVSEQVINESIARVDLISPVDNYRMADRSIKYNFLFLLLTFLVFWLFETATQLSIHPLQYLLVGAAMTMFYLLQLAISEHIRFSLAYLFSSIAVVVLLTAYSVAVLRAKKRGAIIGAMQVALYGYLYVVLGNQDYSLLIGSLGLFLIIAIMMYFTRRMDWVTTAPRPAPIPSAPTSPASAPPPPEEGDTYL
jgi:inner membrane protein